MPRSLPQRARLFVYCQNENCETATLLGLSKSCGISPVFINKKTTETPHGWVVSPACHDLSPDRLCLSGVSPWRGSAGLSQKGICSWGSNTWGGRAVLSSATSQHSLWAHSWRWFLSPVSLLNWSCRSPGQCSCSNTSIFFRKSLVHELILSKHM